MKFFTALIIPVSVFAMLGLTAAETAEASHHADHELVAGDAHKTCGDKDHDCNHSEGGTCAAEDGACCKSIQVAQADSEGGCEDCACVDGCDCADGECSDGCDRCSACEGCLASESGHCSDHDANASGLTTTPQAPKHAFHANEAAVQVLVGSAGEAAARAMRSGKVK